MNAQYQLPSFEHPSFEHDLYQVSQQYQQQESPTKPLQPYQPPSNGHHAQYFGQQQLQQPLAQDIPEHRPSGPQQPHQHPQAQAPRRFHDTSNVVSYHPLPFQQSSRPRINDAAVPSHPPCAQHNGHQSHPSHHVAQQGQIANNAPFPMAQYAVTAQGNEHLQYSAPGTLLPLPQQTATSDSSLRISPVKYENASERQRDDHCVSAQPDLRSPNLIDSTMSAFPDFAPTHAQQPIQTKHVVGSQGRRGILPSAPGRVAPLPPGTVTQSKSLMPLKDADGKFPCPHCDKTYLHAKHLKRHLLRHTGDRPYSCFLCDDTFSRSDILKRHFQKCSLRRGNPTGATHLSHQRRNTSASHRQSVGSTSDLIGLASMPDVLGSQPFAQNGMLNNSPSVNDTQSSYATSIASLSNRSSRANSLIHPATGSLMAQDARHSIGVGISPLHQVTNDDTAHMIPTLPASGFSTFLRHSSLPGIAHGYQYGSSRQSMNVEDYPRLEHGESYTTSGTGTPSTRGSNGSGNDWGLVFGPSAHEEPYTRTTHSQSPVKQEQMPGGQRIFNNTPSKSIGLDDMYAQQQFATNGQQAVYRLPIN